MSRFWAAGGCSDSCSDGSENSSFYSTDGSAEVGGGAGAGAGGANRWVMSDSDSSDDEVRVVKSGKDRALEAFQSHIKNLRTHMKERDYYAIQTEFEAKQYLADGVPRPLVRILVDLEDYTTESLKDKSQFKTLSARQGRALNRMKLTLKKHNKAYQVVIEAYRKNPIVDVSDGESSKASSDSESSKSSSSSSSSGSSSSSSSKGDASVKSSKSASTSGSDVVSDFETRLAAS
jgi:translation initiation factor 3 subunit C